jgi:hypothetical protein
MVFATFCQGKQKVLVYMLVRPNVVFQTKSFLKLLNFFENTNTSSFSTIHDLKENADYIILFSPTLNHIFQ